MFNKRKADDHKYVAKKLNRDINNIRFIGPKGADELFNKRDYIEWSLEFANKVYENPEIIKTIDELPMETKYRVTIAHKNIPNMLTSITGIIANDNINIENLLNKSRGDYAYTMLDIDEADTAQLQTEIEAIDGVIRVRII